MKTYSVYKHTAPNGKVYIGITRQKCEYRWNNGRGYTGSVLFNKAINKYGWENIKHEILYEGLTKEEAEAKEIELIELYKSCDHKYGYNLMSGGDLAVMRHSPESIQKMRDVKKGKVVSEETRRKMSESRKGRIVTPETRKKIADAQRGKPRGKHTEEWKQQMSQHFTDNTWNMRPINQYTKDGEFVASYISINQVERLKGFDNRNVGAVCKGKKKTAYGYVWKYAEGN